VEHGINPKIDAAADELRARCRLKLNVDYAITCKYSEYHLLCCNVFLETIMEISAKHGITFATTHTYAVA
jgi:hypothetical protein